MGGSNSKVSNSSVGDSKAKKKYDKAKTTWQNDFNITEKRLMRISTKYDSLTRSVPANFDALIQLLQKSSDQELFDKANSKINAARDVLLQRARAEQDRILDFMSNPNKSGSNRLSAEERIRRATIMLREFVFNENNKSVETVLMNDLFRINRLDIRDKIKYLRFLAKRYDVRTTKLVQHSVINIDLDVQLLTTGRIFQYWKETMYFSYMQVSNINRPHVLAKLELEIPAFDQLNQFIVIKVFDKNIVYLYHEYAMTVICIYNQRLELTNRVKLGDRFDLMTLSKEEILLRSRSTNEYKNFSYSLDEMSLFKSRLLNDSLKKSLFGSNFDVIFHLEKKYFFVYSNELNLVKIINRENGSIMNSFKIPNAHSSRLKVDSNSRILALIGKQQQNLVQLFNMNGDLLVQTDAVDLKVFDKCELSCSNEIGFFSNKEKLLIYI